MRSIHAQKVQRLGSESLRAREGIEKESEVYRRIGNHPSYSKLIYKGENFIVLKRLKEITLYDAIHKN